jgi:hypothetical protein
MQRRKLIPILLLALTIPTTSSADSHYFFRKGSFSIALSGEMDQVRFLGPIFEENGFQRVASLPDHRPECLVGVESSISGSDIYDMYCFKDESYRGGTFVFSKKESLALLPAVLTVLMSAVRGTVSEGRFILAIPYLACTQAVCLPEKGCIPFTIPQQRSDG